MNHADSGLAHGTSGSPRLTVENGEADIKARENEERIMSENSLPSDDSQLKHIFRNAEGHLSDTPENRRKLVTLSNDSSKFQGKDVYGNSWNSDILSDGSQLWVRYRNGVINNGGKTYPPREWDDDTGFNLNPKRNNTWRKKK